MVAKLAQIVMNHTFLSVIATCAAGCSNTVVLGSECPGQEGPCRDQTLSFPQTPTSSSTDSSILGLPGDGFDAALAQDGGNVEPQDAGSGESVDAQTQVPSADAGGADSGLLQNPSFELRENPAFGQLESQFGSDVLVSELGGFVPLAGVLFANVDPWFACWLGVQVESDLAGRAGGLLATEGQALISAAYGPFIFLPGLFQILDQPLEAGRSYSFRVDALNSGTSSVALRLGATSLACTPPEAFATTPAIASTNGWETYCLTFTPTRALDTFTLVPINLGDPDAQGQVSFDNLRQVEGCPSP